MMLKNTQKTTHGSGISNLEIYRAWVPTQSGYLHFSHLSDPKSNGREKPSVVYWEQGDAGSGGVRYTALHQRRFSQDNPIVNLFPALLRPWVHMAWFREDGRFDFVCLCWHKIGQPWCKKVNPPIENSTDPSSVGAVSLDLGQALYGRLFLFEVPAWSGIARGATLPPEKTFQRHFDNVKNSYKPGVTYREGLLTESFWNTREELSKRALVCMDFTLERDGSATLVRKQESSPAQLILQPNQAKKSGSRETPSEQDPRKQADYIFRFLKDITHEHTHHAPSSDSFLKVYPVEAGQCEVRQILNPSSVVEQGLSPIMYGVTHIPAQQDAIWRQDVLRVLFAMVTKRDLSSHSASKGFLCFIKSFENICHRIHPGFSSPADANLLQESLDASREEEEFKVQTRFRDRSVFFQRLTILGSMLVVLGIVALTPDKKQCCFSDSMIVTFIRDALDQARCYPIISLVFLVIVLILLRMVTSDSFLNKANDIVRIANLLPKKLSPIVLFFVFLILLLFWAIPTAGYLAWILG